MAQLQTPQSQLTQIDNTLNGFIGRVYQLNNRIAYEPTEDEVLPEVPDHTFVKFRFTSSESDILIQRLMRSPPAPALYELIPTVEAKTYIDAYRKAASDAYKEQARIVDAKQKAREEQYALMESWQQMMENKKDKRAKS